MTGFGWPRRSYTTNVSWLVPWMLPGNRFQKWVGEHGHPKETSFLPAVRIQKSTFHFQVDPGLIIKWLDLYSECVHIFCIADAAVECSQLYFWTSFLAGYSQFNRCSVWHSFLWSMSHICLSCSSQWCDQSTMCMSPFSNTVSWYVHFHITWTLDTWICTLTARRVWAQSYDTA